VRRLVSRLLLLGLLVVGIVALARGCDGDEPGVAVTDLEEGRLRHRAFDVERPVRVAVAAAGSFEDPVAAGEAADTTLAATGWIVRRADGAVVWRLDPRRARRSRGTLAEAADTLALEPGVYDAYFAAYGDPDVRTAPPPRSFGARLRRLVSNDGRAWLADAGRWRLAVSAVDPAERDALRERYDDDRAALPEGYGALWASGPVGNRERRTWLFEVSGASPARLRVRASAEAAGRRMADRAFIERMGGAEPDTVWAMSARGSAWAGGARRNRRADTTLALAPGLYRATFATNDRHGWHDWAATPPFVPAAWGLALDPADADAAGRMAALDPWERLPRLASFACVGPDADLRRTFALPDTTDVLVHAEGEAIGSTVYDGARLLRRHASGESEEVWVMDANDTRPAGGGDKNRMAEAALTLPPGTYTLAYFSDSSHDCGSFNTEPPDAPDRWGATLFVLDPGFDLDRVTFEGPPPGDPGPERLRDAASARGIEAAAVNQVGAGGPVLARLTGLGNDVDRTADFTLDADAAVRVYAVGELVPSARLDYGWITDASGAVVWEMTRANTAPAGGSMKNRRFDGRLDLPAGTYTVHFRTDGAHAYGAFLQPPPDDPEAWGIRVERVEPEG
jgi:hypothetical protein